MEAWGRRSYLGPAEYWSVVYLVNFKDGRARLVVCIAWAKSQSAKRASNQPAFMDSCPFITHKCCWPSLPNTVELILTFCTPPSHSGASGGSLDVFQHMASMF